MRDSIALHARVCGNTPPPIASPDPNPNPNPNQGPDDSAPQQIGDDPVRRHVHEDNVHFGYLGSGPQLGLHRGSQLGSA